MDIGYVYKCVCILYYNYYIIKYASNSLEMVTRRKRAGYVTQGVKLAGLTRVLKTLKNSYRVVESSWE